MRHIVYTTLALAALCMATSCQHETLPDTPKNGLRKMIVHASHTDTRTYIDYAPGSNPSENKWLSYWSDNDWIDLFGFSSNGTISGDSEDYPASQGDRNATFTVSFDENNDPLGGNYQYVGVYPGDNAEAIDSNDSRWIDAWGNSSGFRRGIIGNIDWVQHPAPYSFDSRNDLLVSKMEGDIEISTNEYDELVGDISLTFARVGSIAKIQLTGIPQEENVIMGTFSHGNSWQSTGEIIYDPLENKVAVLPSGSDGGGTTIEFGYDGDLPVEDGKAVVWLRVLSGTLRDYFSIEVTTVDYAWSEKTYVRTIDLNGREITFTEGNITAFTVRVYETED